MKVNVVTIMVTHNGYHVTNPLDGGGRFPSQEESWSFESMEKLQKRLPEILEQPFEKRKSETSKR